MNIEFDAYKVKLNDVKPALDGLADSLNVEGLKNGNGVSLLCQVTRAGKTGGAGADNGYAVAVGGGLCNSLFLSPALEKITLR